MGDRRVVVTGIGIISPLGVGIEDNWRRIVDGHSGIRAIDRFDASGIAAVTQALMSSGFSEDDIRKVMGGNVLRVLRAGIVAKDEKG